MKTCREIRPLLEWLAADELDDRRRQWVEAHLAGCLECSRELSAWRSLLAAAAEPGPALGTEIQAIDWNGVTAKIMAGIDAQPAPSRRPVPVFSFAFLAAAAGLIVMVGLGIFFWSRAGSISFPVEGNNRLSASAATRLQSGLAREEVISYLQQSQLMLTDLLDDCASEEVASWEIGLYSRKAKELLLKKKYFQQNLSAGEWVKVRNVSERIDWLNYEILQLEDHQLCSQINRLQRIMENEKLLLKIRLLERDLSYQPYQEV